MNQARAVLLLPEAARFGAQSLKPGAAIALGRADRSQAHEPGRRAQLLRHFTPTPKHWPIAALARQVDAGDAAGAVWLRADPVHIRPDINGARLLAYGEALGTGDEDREALLPALRPLFGDAGFALDAPTPSHWYLRLPNGTRLPDFADPAQALGEDMFEHLAEGPEGRRWRALLSEAQVVLHNHPWNARRAQAGRAPINSLWFWGGGALPDTVVSEHALLCSDDEAAATLARAACAAEPLPQRWREVERDTVFDLDAQRDLARLQQNWLIPALHSLSQGRLRMLDLDLADGSGYRFARGQRWRFWRKPRQLGR
ncbi:MAG TPA: phosphoglycerate mutase [Luteimonas sp.]|nr:phosphoglycerate mutase [Luteimonas sp.]